MLKKSSKTLIFILECAKQYRWLMVGQGLVALFFSLDFSLRPYVLKLLIDGMSVHPQSLNALIGLATAFVALSFVMSLAWRLNDYLWLKLNAGLKSSIGLKLIARMMQHSHQFYQDQFTGSLSNKIKDVMSSIPDLFKLCMQQFLSYMLTPFIATIALWHIDHVIALSLLIWWCFFIGLNAWAVKRGIRLSHNFAQARSTVVGSMVDIIGNMSSIRLFAGQSYELNKFKEPLLDYKDRDQALQWFWLKVMAFQGFSYVSYVAWCLILLIQGYQAGLKSAGDVVMVMTINTTIIEFLWNFSRDINKASEAVGTISQGLELALSPIGITDKALAKELVVTKGSIELSNVSFHYEEAPPLFTNKSIVIHPGEKVGLVGYSGSGKTTFINLILRLYDCKAGSIYIDGQNITELSQQSLHKAISVIPQDTLLFHRSLMENIRYGKFASSDEEVFAAAKKAHAHEFIMRLHQGYQSLVGERGIKLSGGQRQRIAIARAILKNAPILILDEATSQLDSLTEHYIQESLQELMSNKTTIVIAHRLSTLLRMNRILVFEHGKIVQDGTHEVLLNHDGPYKTLWQAQVGGFLPNDAAEVRI